MSKPEQLSGRRDYEDSVTAGRATGREPPRVSEEDTKRLEAAWNDPSFYHAVMDEDGGCVTTGWVMKPAPHPDTRLFPAVEDIEKLPQWARVAFAARCARRVLPLVKRFWKTAPLEQLKSLDVAVKTAENPNVVPSADLTTICNAATAAIEEVRAAFAFQCAQAGAYAAARAVRAAVVYAAHASNRASHASELDSAIECISATAESMFWAATVGTIKSLTAPIRDFELLRWLAEKDQWTDDTPVPPSVFGQMWEETPPSWWLENVLAEPASELTLGRSQQKEKLNDAAEVA